MAAISRGLVFRADACTFTTVAHDPWRLAVALDDDSPLEITTARDGSTLVIAVVGDVDLVTADDFQEALERAIRTDAQQLDVDLAGVQYFGSEAIRHIGMAREAALARGVALRVVRPSFIARRAIEATGMGEVLLSD
jgi:anti-sigma B factor antagonist